METSSNKHETIFWDHSELVTLTNTVGLPNNTHMALLLTSNTSDLSNTASVPLQITKDSDTTIISGKKNDVTLKT